MLKGGISMSSHLDNAKLDKIREKYETVIGLEVHAELSTKTKIFCSCTTEFGGSPNTHCCPFVWVCQEHYRF